MLALYEENSRGYGSVLTWRAQAKEQAGDAAGAVADYERALGAWPDAPNALLGLGRLYLAQSDLASAQRYLRRSIEVHDSGIASDLLGAYFLQIGDNELALREYEAWLARHPDASSALYGRGVARLRLGDERGREDIEQARTSDARVEPHYAERGIVPP